jgi:drug/metabolite transporter (DMT)-like permease
VRLSEVGPSATAFYRVALVLPIYWLLASKDRNAVRASFQRAHLWTLAAVGFFFATDLSLWHWSLRYTTVANSTLLTNLAPVFVLIGARAFLHEYAGRALILSVAIAIAGSAMLVASSAKLARENLFGDILSLITALFYAGYLVAYPRLSLWQFRAWYRARSSFLLHWPPARISFRPAEKAGSCCLDWD